MIGHQGFPKVHSEKISNAGLKRWKSHFQVEVTLFPCQAWKITCSLLAVSIESQIVVTITINKTRHCISVSGGCVCLHVWEYILPALCLSWNLQSWGLIILMFYPDILFVKHSSHVHLLTGQLHLIHLSISFPRICPTVFRKSVAAEWGKWMNDECNFLKNKIRAQFKSLFISHMRCHISVCIPGWKLTLWNCQILIPENNH